MRAVIVGGGLAGMTTALELLKQGTEVVLLEAGERLGGKAGADLAVAGLTEPGSQVPQEHGNHFFPGWYLNTRRLLTELGVLGRLVDMERFHQLRLGSYPRFETLDRATRLRHLPRNLLRGGFLPWTEAALLVYSYLDLACQDEADGALDELSLDSFLRSRPYHLPGMSEWADTLIVRAVATPSARLSALTYQAIVRYWLRCRVPMFSVLDGNLQEAFIDPFARRLRQLGCAIHLGRRVVGFETEGGRVRAARTVATDGAGRESGDHFVLATPPEMAPRLLPEELAAAVPGLEGLRRLVSAPMSALTVHLRRPVPGLPPDHVMLVGSPYEISFLDVSKVWRGDWPGAVLTCNIGHITPLLDLPPAEMSRRLVAELRRYVPVIRAEDVAHATLQANLDSPLLLNTVGSWRWRPLPGATPVANLYLAGDYCRSAANVTSMEGAIASGIEAAAAVLARAGRAAPEPVLAPQAPPLELLRALRLLLLPAALLVSSSRRNFLSGLSRKGA